MKDGESIYILRVNASPLQTRPCHDRMQGSKAIESWMTGALKKRMSLSAHPCNFLPGVSCWLEDEFYAKPGCKSSVELVILPVCWVDCPVLGRVQ